MKKFLTNYNQVSEISYAQLDLDFYCAIETLALDFIPRGTFLNEESFITWRIQDITIQSWTWLS